MFVLSRVEDVIRLEPSSFDRSTIDSLEDEINRKYANKVIHDVGLCICVYDVESHGEGLIKPGDGAVYVKSMSAAVQPLHNNTNISCVPLSCFPAVCWRDSRWVGFVLYRGRS